MEDILLVIDMQNDFIDGTLGTKEAKSILHNVLEKINNHKGRVIYTRDTHHENYLNTQEGKMLPVTHCVKDTFGWRLSSEIEQTAKVKNSLVFDKPSFGSIELSKYIKDLYDAGEVGKIELVGLCTDICVISNAMILKAAMPEALIEVDSRCCAGVTPESHKNALNAMKMCQIVIK